MNTPPSIEDAKKFYTMELKKFTAQYSRPAEEEALIKNSQFLDYFRRRIIDASNRLAAYEYEKNTTAAPHADWGPAELTRQLVSARLIQRIVDVAEADLLEEMQKEMPYGKKAQKPKGPSFFQRCSWFWHGFWEEFGK